MRAASVGPLPSSIQHGEQVRRLLPIAEIAEMPAVIVDRDARAQGFLEPASSALSRIRSSLLVRQ
jgi:hypothetical protein